MEKRLKYIHIDTDRHGNRRVYFRRYGVKIRLPSDMTAPSFDRAYQTALTKSERGEPLPKRLPPQAQPSEGGTGFVYILRAGDHFKIGFSTNAMARLFTLKTSGPIKVDFMIVVPGTVAMERLLHLKFTPNRVAGEWFKVGPNFDNLVRQLTNGSRIDVEQTCPTYPLSKTVPPKKDIEKQTLKRRVVGPPGRS